MFEITGISKDKTAATDISISPELLSLFSLNCLFEIGSLTDYVTIEQDEEQLQVMQLNFSLRREFAQLIRQMIVAESIKALGLDPSAVAPVVQADLFTIRTLLALLVLIEDESIGYLHFSD